MRTQENRVARAVLSIAAAMVPASGTLACNAVLKIDELELGECQAGEIRCASNAQPQTCDGERRWQNQAPCIDQTCIFGACIGDCQAGKKRCGGTTPEICGADGQWQAQAICRPGEVCKGGACVILCIPGDLQCDGDQPQGCDPAGVWRDDGSRCAPCIGCDPTTGRCSVTPKPDGATCDDQDACSLATTCQSGACTALPALTVQCIAESQCSPGACDPVTGSCAAMDGSLCDDHDACTPQSTCAGGVCNPGGERAFARWDLRAPAPNPRFLVVAYAPGFESSEVVYDERTHLLWERSMKGEASVRDHQQAKSYCEGLSLPGYPSGWRLPSRIELASLVDYSRNELPSIDTAAFPWLSGSLSGDVQEFWSSSPSAKNPTHAWIVAFNGGLVFTTPQIKLKNVRCVH